MEECEPLDMGQRHLFQCEDDELVRSHFFNVLKVKSCHFKLVLKAPEYSACDRTQTR